MIMSILSGNLAEGQKKATSHPCKPTPTPVESKAITISSQYFTAIEEYETEPLSSASQQEKQVHIFLKFNFTMESFVVDLYSGAAETVFGGCLIEQKYN